MVRANGQLRQRSNGDSLGQGLNSNFLRLCGSEGALQRPRSSVQYTRDPRRFCSPCPRARFLSFSAVPQHRLRRSRHRPPYFARPLPAPYLASFSDRPSAVPQWFLRNTSYLPLHLPIVSSSLLLSRLVDLSPSLSVNIVLPPHFSSFPLVSIIFYITLLP